MQSCIKCQGPLLLCPIKSSNQQATIFYPFLGEGQPGQEYVKTCQRFFIVHEVDGYQSFTSASAPSGSGIKLM